MQRQELVFDIVLNVSASKLDYNGINVLSIGGGKVLISASRIKRMYLFKLDFLHKHFNEVSHGILIDAPLIDAVPTPRGFVYLSGIANVNSKLNKTNYATTMSDPRSISSFNNILYVTDYEKGFLQSVDEGISWKLFFRPRNNWHGQQFIEVGKGYYWSLEAYQNSSHYYYQLCVYNVNEKFNLPSSIINLPAVDNKQIDLKYCKLLSGCETYVFVLCHWNRYQEDSVNSVLFVFSFDGTYKRAILLSFYINSMYVDAKCDQFYAGLGRVKLGKNVSLLKFTAQRMLSMTN